jgi:hypothetical protein
MTLTDLFVHIGIRFWGPKCGALHVLLFPKELLVPKSYAGLSHLNITVFQVTNIIISHVQYHCTPVFKNCRNLAQLLSSRRIVLVKSVLAT